MILQPKILGYICTTAHPLGCATMVERQIHYVKSRPPIINGPKNVLVIGASTGYGLASRIVSTFGAGAKTIGIFFEKAPDETHCATPGWYNSAAFEDLASKDGFYAKSINGDAFSSETKMTTIELLKRDGIKIDLVIYSLASPRRKHPVTGEIFNSVLKPVGNHYVEKTIDAFRGEIKDVDIAPANENEIANTIAVMGGEDWEMWITQLKNEGVLSDDFTTVAYSYFGPPLVHQIYKNGTIGKAKEHLKMTADKLNHINGKAFVSVNKAVITQASSAIPVVPLYLSVLIKVMKEKGVEEGCIEQIYRLFYDNLYRHPSPHTDGDRYIHLDSYELDPSIQEKVSTIWSQINANTLQELTDIEGYRKGFKQLFGFDVENIDYNADINPVVTIKSLV